MKVSKKIISLLLCVLFIASCFAGCSSSDGEKYSDKTVIIGYTENAAPFIEVDKNGKATGFEADLWKNIFDDVKGELENYRFEKVEEGYALEEDGGFFDSKDKEYSAALLIGAVSKNDGTFNEDYSFTEPIITNRVITVTAKSSKVKAYTDFAGANVIVVSDAAKQAFDKNSAISSVCKKVTQSDSIDEALAALDSGKADAVVTDEFNYMPSGKTDNYVTLEGELDAIEYVIACAKHSGWKDSINEAIREQESKDYGDGDTFTPLVEKYFGYNASSFDYQPANE